MLEKPTRAFVVAWFLVFAILSTVWCWSVAWTIGPTFDEPFYVRSGMRAWAEWNAHDLLELGTMPLPALEQTLPLALAKALGFLSADEDPLAWLAIARMGSGAFWWLLLGASYRLAAIYGGPWAGCLAVALVACEPILLGHAALAATDLPFAACLLQLLAVFRGRRDRVRWTSRLLPAACWVALTFLAKASALVFVPICLTAIEAERLFSGGWRPANAGSWRALRASALDLLAIGIVGMMLMFAVCPQAWLGIEFQISHNSVAAMRHLFGSVSPRGFALYFPATLVVKFGLPVLILLAVSLVLGRRDLSSGALWAGLCLLAATPQFRVQLGVRFVLAIGVLLTIAGAIALARWHARQDALRQTGATAFAGLLVAASFASAWMVWPNGLCFVNPLFGGTRDGYRVLSESNYDWGQGLPELLRWQKAHSDAPLSLWYFGKDPAADASPFRLVKLSDAEDADEVRARVAGTYLAASTTYLYTYYAKQPVARFLRSIEPYDQTTNYLIYDFRDVDPAKLPVRKR